jgi:hypothetical protein
MQEECHFMERWSNLMERKVYLDGNRENFKFMKQNPIRQNKSPNQLQIRRSPKLHSSLTVRKRVIVLYYVLHNVTLIFDSRNLSGDAGNTWHVAQNENIKPRYELNLCFKFIRSLYKKNTFNLTTEFHSTKKSKQKNIQATLERLGNEYEEILYKTTV